MGALIHIENRRKSTIRVRMKSVHLTGSIWISKKETWLRLWDIQARENQR